jgi:predicted esterase
MRLRDSTTVRLFCSALPNLPAGAFYSALAGLLFLGAILWAVGRDPFERIWFRLQDPRGSKAECIAILPKMAARPSPVVCYLHGSGESLSGSGKELRQIAEMGLAAVGMEYCQTDKAVFEAQFAALLDDLRRQPWADVDRVNWVGYGLGAQWLLSFALRHPGSQPKLLIGVAGGRVPELDERPARSGVDTPGTSSAQDPTALKPQASRAGGGPPRMSVLLVHPEQEGEGPLPEAQEVEARLGTNGAPVAIKILRGGACDPGGCRLAILRATGEYCLTHSGGADALENYRSIFWWQARASPLWVYEMPAFVWTLLWCCRRRCATAGRVCLLPRAAAEPACPENKKQEGTTQEPALLRGQCLLRWVAAILALAALVQTALHLVPPRLAASGLSLEIARRYLVQPKEKDNLDFLASDPVWRDRKLSVLLDHVELASYNRALVAWRLDERIYRCFVLSPLIDPAFDGTLEWRRPLWESFYPRIRKEPTPEAAAEIAAQYLRERVTIAKGGAFPATIKQIWERQITDERGFEAIYVATLRSVGVPARLDARGRAEFWSGSSWRTAPRPPVESWG